MQTAVCLELPLGACAGKSLVNTPAPVDLGTSLMASSVEVRVINEVVKSISLTISPVQARGCSRLLRNTHCVEPS